MGSKDEIRFTPAQYEEYEQQPHWKKDDTEGVWKDESDQESYWCGEIRKWKRQYDEQFKGTVTQWADSIDYIEHAPSGSYDVFSPETQIAQQRVPLALCAMLEIIALIYTNYPEPIFLSPGQQQDEYSAALQQITKIVLKQNSFNTLMFDLGVDVGFASMGILKSYVDMDQTGPFGDQGKIIIEKIDPMKVAFDPRATRLKWSHMQFFMVTDMLDLGTVRRQYPNTRYKPDSYFQSQKGEKNADGLYGSHLVSPVPNEVEGNAADRNKVKVVECWFKDERQVFVADKESVINREFKTDDAGNQVANSDYDSEKPDVFLRPVVDKDGFVVGDWLPAYPHGRCIVTANDRHIIADFSNPFWHNQAPFTFFRGRPGRRTVTTGDLTNIVNIDKKINDILGRIHIMAQAEIERPMLADVNTFKTPRAWMRMSGMSTAVLVRNPGREFLRMPPTEIPQFVFALLAKLEEALDKVMAVAGVMRGDLTEGSQLSAEAVSSLQGMASTMLKLKAELVVEGIKDLAYQLMWLERMTYPENIPISITLPDGSSKVVQWNEDDLSDDYIVDIESASGLPGSQNSTPAAVLPMFTNGLIDRVAALQMLKVNGWQAIVQRFQSEKLAEIEAAAAGKATGVAIKEFEKTQETGAEGRKAKL